MDQKKNVEENFKSVSFSTALVLIYSLKCTKDE